MKVASWLQRPVLHTEGHLTVLFLQVACLSHKLSVSPLVFSAFQQDHNHPLQTMLIPTELARRLGIVTCEFNPSTLQEGQAVIVREGGREEGGRKHRREEGRRYKEK